MLVIMVIHGTHFWTQPCLHTALFKIIPLSIHHSSYSMVMRQGYQSIFRTTNRNQVKLWISNYSDTSSSSLVTYKILGLRHNKILARHRKNKNNITIRELNLKSSI